VTIPAGPDALDAAWIEDVLRDGGLPAACVRRVATQIIGVGYGLDGTSARVTLEGDGVPATLVAKWSAAADARIETSFYREVAPRLDLRLAALLGARIDDETKRGALLLSDVAPAKQGDTLVGTTDAESDALCDAMASFHATFWGAPEDPVLATFPLWIDTRCPYDRIAERLPKFVADWTGRVPPAALDAAMRLPERVPLARASLARAPATLVHTDLHLDNVLFLEGGAPVILDWTDARRGPAALDFARLLIEGMTSAARRARQERLTRRYHAALAARGVAYHFDRLRGDVADAATVIYAAVVLWAAGPDALGPDLPRVPLIVESVVRSSADAAIDPACGAA